MTNNERELLNTIRQAEHPDIAIETAISLITAYLKQPLAIESIEVASLQALA